VTEEDAFQAKLDADPDDATTRLVFADWLDERGDPRASGYRALGHLGKRPNKSPNRPGLNPNLPEGCWEWWLERPRMTPVYRELPAGWFEAIRCTFIYQTQDPVTRAVIDVSKDFLTRREAEDAAALAYPGPAETETQKEDPGVSQEVAHPPPLRECGAGAGG